VSDGDADRCDGRNNQQVQNDHEKVESRAIVAAPSLVPGRSFDRAGLERPLEIGSSDRDSQKIRRELSCGDPLVAKSCSLISSESMDALPSVQRTKGATPEFIPSGEFYQAPGTYRQPHRPRPR
jgi:hypothetical protein